MATAKAKTATIKKVVLQEVTETVGLTLELTGDEVRALSAVLARVGGDPSSSRRRLIDNINRAMREAGFIGWDASDMSDASLYFK